MRTLGIMFLLLLCVQGCGRKGPLYLPQAQAGFSDTYSHSLKDEASHE
ncbi:LPS translocon maturation chaperone LptM [Ferrigenium sp. UT5]